MCGMRAFLWLSALLATVRWAVAGLPAVVYGPHVRATWYPQPDRSLNDTERQVRHGFAASYGIRHFSSPASSPAISNHTVRGAPAPCARRGDGSCPGALAAWLCTPWRLHAGRRGRSTPSGARRASASGRSASNGSRISAGNGPSGVRARGVSLRNGAAHGHPPDSVIARLGIVPGGFSPAATPEKRASRGFCAARRLGRGVGGRRLVVVCDSHGAGDGERSGAQRARGRERGAIARG